MKVNESQITKKFLNNGYIRVPVSNYNYLKSIKKLIEDVSLQYAKPNNYKYNHLWLKNFHKYIKNEDLNNIRFQIKIQPDLK